MDKIDEFIASQKETIAEDREETLISLGLFEKEYAPNNQFSRQYKEFDIENGEKRYYRKKALAVTEAQWAEIVTLQAQLEEIESRKARKEEAERKKAEKRTSKKWIPVFEMKEDSDVGKSKIAFILRVIAILWACVGGVLGVITLTEGLTGFVLLASVALSVVLLYAIAEILSYLSELTAIAKEGFQYSEKNKN